MTSGAVVEVVDEEVELDTGTVSDEVIARVSARRRVLTGVGRAVVGAALEPLGGIRP